MIFTEDRLVMLLSSDWFLPHWFVIGILTTEKEKYALQYGCRDIVEQFMAGKSVYFNIDFGLERVSKTRSVLQALIQHSIADQSTIARITQLTELKRSGAGEEFPLDEGTQWLLVAMTEQLLNDTFQMAVPRLHSSIKEVLVRNWPSGAGVDYLQLEKDCITSCTDWDLLLRSITPDQPTVLFDYALSVLDNDKFAVLWKILTSELQPMQIKDLHSWYSSVAEILTSESLRWKL